MIMTIITSSISYLVLLRAERRALRLSENDHLTTWFIRSGGCIIPSSHNIPACPISSGCC
jgi:hypothetical protein